MNGLEASARRLFQAGMAIFTVTIVIGILNGMDVWEPSHQLLLTHVHAGTLGWITLAVIGAAMLMFDREDGSRDDVRSSDRVAALAIVAAAIYVAAFASTGGIMRPVAGTLMLVAIVWVLAWVWSRYRTSAGSTAQLGILLALISLTIGAVLGVLLGVVAAGESIPGLSDEMAGSLAGAHPPAMLIGYLILAGAAITHWLLGGTEARAGRLVMWALFTAGIFANVSFIFEVDALIQVATLIEVVAIVTFVVHLRSRLAPEAWGSQDADDFARVSVVFLAVGIALLVNVVRLIMSGELDPETGEGPIGLLLAFDHAMFVGVMTNALFALVGRTTGMRANPVVLWGVNGGLVLFLLGLVTDTAILKQVGAPVMGVLLLYGLYLFFTHSVPRQRATVA